LFFEIRGDISKRRDIRGNVFESDQGSQPVDLYHSRNECDVHYVPDGGRRHPAVFSQANPWGLRVGCFFRGYCHRILTPFHFLGERSYLSRFSYFKVSAEDKKYLQYRYTVPGHRAIPDHRLEPDSVRNGSQKSGRGVPDFANTFLSDCLRNRRMLFCPLSGIDLRYNKDFPRGI
jgi:hypothetical protein